MLCRQLDSAAAAAAAVTVDNCIIASLLYAATHVAVLVIKLVLI